VRAITVLGVCLAVATRLEAQDGVLRSEYCGAAVCQDAAIYVAALDSVQRQLAARGSHCAQLPPRVLGTLHLAPFRRLDGSLSPAVLRASDVSLDDLLSRKWRAASVADSADVVRDSSGRLRTGGCLYVLAPVVWLGPSQARVLLAEYPERINYGAEFFVFLRHDGFAWRVTSVEYGMQN